VTGSPTNGRALEAAGWAAFALLGWSGLLVPSLIREIEHDFGQSDAGMAGFYLVLAASYVAGSFGGAILTERVGRRPVLVASLGLQAAGLLAQAVVPAWVVFVVAGVPRGLGSGGIEGGIQGLFLDAFPDRSARAMNVLHLFFSVGALVAPIGLASLVTVGLTWQALTVASALFALAVGAPYVVLEMPSGRHHGEVRTDGVTVGLPLILAAVAIAAYVAAEVGISSWLVRYLAAAPLTLATGALTLFWAGLTAGRIVAARLGDRVDPVRLAIAAAVAAAIAIVAAVAVPSVPASIALFTTVGFAFGPIYPTIMLVADRFYPGRAAAVTGLLAGVAVVGSVGYPPLMGAISVSAGLGVGMVGAAGLSVACALLLGAAARARARGSPA
jgi:fucose permease